MLMMAAFTILSMAALAQADARTITDVTTCPMHPAVTNTKPGKCPMCVMELKKTAKKAKACSCPVHSEVTSDRPGKCTKCGNDLLGSPKEKMKTVVMKMLSCTTHPYVTSDKPGNCSRCGMDLTKMKNKQRKKND